MDGQGEGLDYIIERRDGSRLVYYGGAGQWVKQRERAKSYAGRDAHEALSDYLETLSTSTAQAIATQCRAVSAKVPA